MGKRSIRPRETTCNILLGVPYILEMFDIPVSGDRYDRGGFQGIGCASTRLSGFRWKILQVKPS